MPRRLREQARRIQTKIQTLNFFADAENVSGLILCRQLAKELERDCLLLQSGLGIFYARIHPESERLKKVAGSRHEQARYDAGYRCWACGRFGYACINTFLNRPACNLFVRSQMARKYPNRIRDMKKSKGNRPPKLKPPVLQEFNHHYPKCRVCNRLAEQRKEDWKEKQIEHYLKAKNRKRRKLAVYFNFHGVRYSEDYIYGWEE